jgi:hypothetical protein
MPQMVLADTQYYHAFRHHRKTAPCRANPCQGGGTCLNGPHPSTPTLCICPPDREGKMRAVKCWNRQNLKSFIITINVNI